MPNTGPKDGSLKATAALKPSFLSPSASPTDVVVLPSPAGVGLIAVTNTNLPSGSLFKASADKEIFAL